AEVGSGGRIQPQRNGRHQPPAFDIHTVTPRRIGFVRHPDQTDGNIFPNHIIAIDRPALEFITTKTGRTSGKVARPRLLGDDIDTPPGRTSSIETTTWTFQHFHLLNRKYFTCLST